MKRIINGVTYDTETAMPIAGLHSKLDPSYAGTFGECLYETPDGRFFIAGHRRGTLSRLFGVEETGYIRPVPGSAPTIIAAVQRNLAAVRSSGRAVASPRRWT